jgi:Cof subfamily protein (haloacid dehalogenase superfamily)
LPLSPEELNNKLRNVKLIVSDIDGTLVTSEHRLNDDIIHLANKLEAKGVSFSIASQRVLSSIKPIAEKLNIKIPIISLNGSLIQDIMGENILYKGIINSKFIEKAVQFAEKYFVKIALSYNDVIVYTEDNSTFKDFFPIPDAEYLCIESYNEKYYDGVLRIYMAGNEKKSILKIKSRIKPFFNFALRIDYFRSHSHKSLYKLEIQPAGVSKKKALGILAKNLGVTKDEIVVIGDWYNDVELFEFGAINVTLNNGIMDLKKRADYVSPYSNDEGGMEDFLNILYNSKN